jgi:predicted  nucleic acid-binding Zn-ribbon protein
VPYFTPGGPQVTAQQELEGLKQQAEYFKDELDEINKRIEQLEKESDK